MKEINLKKIMEAYSGIRKYGKNVKFYASIAEGNNRYLEREQALLSEAETAFDEASAPIDAVLSDVQKRCSMRTISVRDILDSLISIEDRLGISKKAMEGIDVSVDINGQKFPGAYKGIPQSTIFDARYKSGSWRLTDIRRDTTRGLTNGYRVNLTDSAKTAIIERMSVFG